MIGLLALALQAATPDVVTDTVSVGPTFQVTAETKPMIFRYMDCLQPPGLLLRPPTSGTAVAQAEARIAACADTRKWALSTGVSVYRREPGGDPDATHFLNRSLDTLEQGLLRNAQFTDKLISGVIKPADLQHQPVIADPGGT